MERKLIESIVNLTVTMTCNGSSAEQVVETILDNEREAEIESTCGACGRFKDDCDGIGSLDQKKSVVCEVV